MFAVVLADRDYDYIRGIECVETFYTESEAEGFVKDLIYQRDSSCKERVDYIDSFVEAIELPETDYHGWLEFLKQFHPFGDTYVFPKDFKEIFKRYLFDHSYTAEGYNPPKWLFCNANDYFVVEIK